MMAGTADWLWWWWWCGGYGGDGISDSREEEASSVLVGVVDLLCEFPLKSANPLIPNVSASERRVEICSSYTFTSPEYIKVRRATTAGKDAPGRTITG